MAAPRVTLHVAAPPLPLPPRTFARLLARAARRATRKAIALGVVIVDDRAIRRLNRRFLGHDRATDVIAFPTTGKSKVRTQKSEVTAGRRRRAPVKPSGSLPLPSDFCLLTSPDLLGEVYVSMSTARREAKARDIPFGEELLRYAIHGMLHLFGYDDAAPAARQRMWRRQEELVGALMPAAGGARARRSGRGLGD